MNQTYFNQAGAYRYAARIFMCVMLLAVFFSGMASAAQSAITIIVSEDAGAYLEVSDKIKSTLNQAQDSRLAVTVMTPPAALSKSADSTFLSSQLIVVVGVHAAETVAALAPHAPVLNVLLPKSAFEQIERQKPGGALRNSSAIFLDQPLTRRFSLLRLALPGRKRVGVMLGPESGQQLKLLQVAAREQGMSLHAETIGAESELMPALQRVLADSDALLAMPDPVVFNRSTAQGLLLTTYRAQVPVLGFSKSYVNAGALTAVYSTPAQIGQQAGEIIQRMNAARNWTLPPPQYPKYFSVSVNQQVARSLGIAVEDENSLSEKLRNSPEREP